MPGVIRNFLFLFLPSASQRLSGYLLYMALKRSYEGKEPQRRRARGEKMKRWIWGMQGVIRNLLFLFLPSASQRLSVSAAISSI